MRVVGKNVIERIMEHHLGKKVRVTKEAATLMYLHHLIFMKQLAKACDNAAFRQRRMKINGEDVLNCSPRLLTAFCETEKMVSRTLRKPVSSGNSTEQHGKEGSWQDTTEDEDEADEPEMVSEGEGETVIATRAV